MWDDGVRQEGDAESCGGEVGGCRDLTGLFGCAGREAGACADFEDEFGEAVVWSEQDPGAVGEVFEGHRAPASCERVES